MRPKTLFIGSTNAGKRLAGSRYEAASMICPRCGADVATNKRFCGDCGTALPWLCGSCGSENPADKRFCGDCGTAHGVTPGAPQIPPAVPVPERRMLSVMIVDLVGSTALGQRLDPEDLREAINAFHAHVTSLVACFNGFIARHMGDGVLVYFGYPQADEADAERGTVVISDATRLLVGSLFEYHELTLPNLKGRRRAERAWVVRGESVIQSRYQALRRGQLSLVNRTEELELLTRRWEQAKA